MPATDPYRHLVPLPALAEPAVAVGAEVQPGDELARALKPGPALSVPMARPLRRKGTEVIDILSVSPGTLVRANQRMARAGDREVRAPSEALFLAYEPGSGSARLLPLEPADAIRSDVRGIVMEVTDRSITVAVPAVVINGTGGTGPSVSGPLSILVDDPEAPLDPTLIDADLSGRIVVAGSWASAEAITRARAVGVAGVVVGSLHARDLADFAGLQHRRSLLGTAAPPFAILALDGFGRAGMDPARFAWLKDNGEQQATVLGDRRRLLVYDASPAPTRAPRPGVGDRLIIVAGPGRGQAGLLTDLPVQAMAIGSGISTLCGTVRLDSGRTVSVALANVEASLTGG